VTAEHAARPDISQTGHEFQCKLDKITHRRPTSRRSARWLSGFVRLPPRCRLPDYHTIGV
jgi:hypothetical protein